MENKKKVMIVLSVAILVLIVIGSSYAYFIVGVSEKAERNIRVTTSTTDTLLFEMGSDISFKATQSEFVESGNNAVGTTTAKAILKANNETNRATDHYYFYLDINKNDFVYTSDEQTAELILTIKKPDNTYLTSIEGLEYVTVGSVSGFDITESTDLIKIAENKEIVATNANNNTTEEEWELTITFVNLDSNQNDNAGRTFEAKMIMQKEKINNLFADYIKNLYTTDGVNGLYLHDSDLANGANDNSLRYAGADYTMSAKAVSAGYNTIAKITAGTVVPSNTIILHYCNGFNGNLCNSKTKTFYHYLNYDTNQTHYNTYDEVLEQAVSDGYLNSGNINNFVCFGSDDETCPVDNLYRIIGVFGNHVKLIKYDYVTDHLGTNGTFINSYTEFNMDTRGSHPDLRYYYDVSAEIDEPIILDGKEYYTVWPNLIFNKTNLNTNYLNNIGDKWRNMITGHKYSVGGMNYSTSGTASWKNQQTSTMIDQEINHPDTTFASFHKNRVGLAYVSDFVYSVADLSSMPTFNTIRVNFTNSWMPMGEDESTMTRVTSIEGIFSIRENLGNIVAGIYGGQIRPVFYLATKVKYLSGSGTKNNPYRIG